MTTQTTCRSSINHFELDKFLWFIGERYYIYTRRLAGAPKPWTTDPMMQKYKFTNVFREHDRVTIWIDRNIRKKYNPENMLVMLCIARFVNHEIPLEEIVDEIPANEMSKFIPAIFHRVMMRRAMEGVRLYGNAYMTHGAQGMPKYLYHTRCLETIRDFPNPFPKTLHETWETLVLFPGQGPFISAQVVADLKHTSLLENAPDWWDWAALGPGSTRGLNRLYSRGLDKPVKFAQALDEMRYLRDLAAAIPNVPRMCLQNLQNCLCEYSKYQRGYSKTLFQGT